MLKTRPDDPRSETRAYAIRYAPGVAEPAQALRLPVRNGEIADFGTMAVPEAARLSAQVVRPEGDPWEGIPLILRAADGSTRREALSGPDGRVRFSGLEPGGYRLWVNARGTPAISEAWDGSRDTLASAPLTLERGEIRSGIILTPDVGARVSGVVRNSETDDGLSGIEVRFFPADDPADIYTFLTDELGFYIAWGLPTDSYKIYVPAIRRYFIDTDDIDEARAIRVAEGEEYFTYDLKGRIDPECRMDPNTAGVVEGTVRADFIRMPSARVVVFGDRDTAELTVTEAGLFHVGCLRAGEYRIGLFPEGVYRTQYHPKVSVPDSAVTFSVTEGDTVKRIDFKPDLGVTIQGTVLSQSDQQPLEGVPILVILESPPLMSTGYTDDTGAFRIDRLPDGTGLPAGNWVVGSDSVTVAHIAQAPQLTAELAAQRNDEEVSLEFLFPEAATVLDWSLDRRERGGATVRIVEAASHPEGLLAKEYVDVFPPMGETAYRLEVECDEGGQTIGCSSPWVWIEGLPTLLHPQPWNGTSELKLPGIVRDGERVNLIAPDGRCVGRAIAQDERVVFEDSDRLASGVYFIRWRDRSGRQAVARLVIQR
jgi:hypothetical protein